MPDTMHYKAAIKNRLEEKRRQSRAKDGIAWMLMTVSGLIMFTLIWLSLFHAGRHFDRPVPFVMIVPVQGIALYTLWKARAHILRSELRAATICLLLTIVIATLSLVMLANGTYQWSGVLRHLPRLSSGNFVLFFVFYATNLLVALAYLVLLYRMIRHFELHSRNMDRFNRTLVYLTGLAAVFAAFVLAVSL